MFSRDASAEVMELPAVASSTASFSEGFTSQESLGCCEDWAEILTAIKWGLNDAPPRRDDVAGTRSRRW